MTIGSDQQCSNFAEWTFVMELTPSSTLAPPPPPPPPPRCPLLLLPSVKLWYLAVPGLGHFPESSSQVMCAQVSGWQEQQAMHMCWMCGRDVGTS